MTIRIVTDYNGRKYITDEVIEMARQVGVEMSFGEHWAFFIEELEAFAKLVEAKAIEREREACAKLCDLAMLQNQEAINELEEDEHDFISFIQGAMTQLVKTSKSIRARGRA